MLTVLFRLVGSPFLVIVFAVAALLAAGRTSRWLLWIATAIEAAVTVGGAGRFLLRI